MSFLNINDPEEREIVDYLALKKQLKERNMEDGSSKRLRRNFRIDSGELMRRLLKILKI